MGVHIDFLIAELAKIRAELRQRIREHVVASTLSPEDDLSQIHVAVAGIYALNLLEEAAEALSTNLVPGEIQRKIATKLIEEIDMGVRRNEGRESH